jgi:hypothetical protein
MTKRDLEVRARRLSSLLDGLNAELVRLPMEKEQPVKPTVTGKRSSRWRKRHAAGLAHCRP